MPPTIAPDASKIDQEQDFVTSFAAKLEAEAQDRSPSDVADPKDTPSSDTSDDTPEPDTDPKDERETEPDAEVAPTDEKPKGEKPKAKPDAAKKDGEQDDDEERDDNEEPTAPDVSAEMLAELKRHGLKASIDDVPAEARPLVERKLAEMHSAFTRAQQDATTFRSERAQFIAERRFFEEHPELALAEVLDKKPELIDAVQAQLDRIVDPDKRKLFGIELEQARAASLKAVEDERNAQDAGYERGARISSYARRAADKMNIPWEAVENAVVVALQAKDGERDLTEPELDTIIERQARIFRRHTAATVREDRKRSIRERTEDRKTTSPASRIGGGSAPVRQPSSKAPTNDTEFISHMESKRSGAGR